MLTDHAEGGPARATDQPVHGSTEERVQQAGSPEPTGDTASREAEARKFLRPGNATPRTPLTTPTAVAPHRLLRPQQSPSPLPRRRLAVSVGGFPGPSQPEGLEGAACLSPGAASPSFPPLAAALPGPASHRASRPGARGASVHPVSHPALWRAERPGDP